MYKQLIKPQADRAHLVPNGIDTVITFPSAIIVDATAGHIRFKFIAATGEDSGATRYLLTGSQILWSRWGAFRIENFCTAALDGGVIEDGVTAVPFDGAEHEVELYDFTEEVEFTHFWNYSNGSLPTEFIPLDFQVVEALTGSVYIPIDDGGGDYLRETVAQFRPQVTGGYSWVGAGIDKIVNPVNAQWVGVSSLPNW